MPKDVWTKVMLAVKTRVPASVYQTWFRPLKPLAIKGATLLILAPNPMARRFIGENYAGLFQEVLQELGLQDLIVELVDDPSSLGEELSLSPVQPRAKAKPPEAQEEPIEEARVTSATPLNASYRFDGFVIGPSNQFAFAACQAVSQSPSKAYNPLYIYGGVGLGKTHLMQSIGAELKAHWPRLSTVYLSAERFTNEMISSIAHRQQFEFRERYRNVDVLLLDDVQFLAGKAGTQEELFHTFNALYEAQKQLVISSDCPPSQLDGIEERLRSRFEWGLIADIQPPELETRVAILYKKAESHGITIPEEVALFIASHINSNIRELEGCLVRLVAFSSFKGLPITLDLAKQTFDALFKGDGRVVTVEAIQKHVAASYKIRLQDIKSKTNKAEIVLPRQVAMYLCKELTNASLPEIGRKFGGKHHSTVLHSIRKVEAQMAADAGFKQRVNTFLSSLR
ncbi:MAG: chromosomal replication initiator protein DnaA [Acidobacteria bacterium]|nr:chromosomal replication initiator protein DnaA [Acidobacteriota bacterium]